MTRKYEFISHACAVCGEMLIPRKKECPSQYNPRKRCDVCKDLPPIVKKECEEIEYKLRDCPVCGKPIVPRPGMKPSAYDALLTCGKECGHKYQWILRKEKNCAGRNAKKPKFEKSDALSRLNEAHKFLKGLSFR